MEAAVILGTIAVVFILFYKVVERNHKILFFKIVGSLVLLLFLSATGYFTWDHYSKEKKKEWLSVEYSDFSDNMDREARHRLAEEVFNSIYDQYDWFFKEVDKKHIEVAKLIVLSDFMNQKKLSVDWNDIFRFPGSDNAMKLKNKLHTLFFSYIKDEISEEEFKKQERELEDQMVTELRSAIPKLEVNSTNALLLYAWKERSWLGGREQIVDKLLQPFSRAINTIDNIHKRAVDLMWEKINAQKLKNTKITFEICNTRDKPLEQVTFRVVGRKEGRSSEYKIRQNDSRYRDYSELTSDIIVDPNECSEIEWTGPYIHFDEYVIKYTKGKWADGERFSTNSPLSKDEHAKLAH